MMETEDEARVSLEEDLSDGSAEGRRSDGDVGEAKAAVQRFRDREKKAQARQARRVTAGDAGRKQAWKRLFGLRQPLVGGETWASVGTSWVFSDNVHTLWRFASFGLVVGLYSYLVVVRSLALEYYATDVFLCVLATSSLLLLPNIAICLAGPHEDELDAPGLRWAWTVVTVVYQTTVTSVIFICLSFWILSKSSQSAAAGGGAMDPYSQLLLHVVSLLTTGGELVFGCIEMRASYALLGVVALAGYLAAVVGGHHRATGQWLYGFLQRDTTGEVVRAHLAVVMIYLAAVAVVLVTERARKGLANWLERRHFQQTTCL
jgi:hypothetical protein